MMSRDQPQKQPGSMSVWVYRIALAGFVAMAGLLACGSLSGASAQLKITGDSQPVTVEADDGIEWNSEKKIYIARGNAKATRGTTSVTGQTLTALYRQTKSEETEIFRLEAQGRVVIETPDRRAFGDRAVYDLDQALAVVRGKNLRMITSNETITASKSLEYWERRQVAVARGDAVATQGTRMIQADTLTAFFAPGRDKKLEAVRIEAIGNVVVTTLHEVARGNEGVYNVKTGIATLSGNVKVTRGDTQLNGATAEVNFNTGISRLLSARNSTSTGRVRGLFIPKSKSQTK
jgi:lipopolysaccharide export system protein LptA